MLYSPLQLGTVDSKHCTSSSRPLEQSFNRLCHSKARWTVNYLSSTFGRLQDDFRIPRSVPGPFYLTLHLTPQPVAAVRMRSVPHKSQTILGAETRQNFPSQSLLFVLRTCRQLSAQTCTLCCCRHVADDRSATFNELKISDWTRSLP